jgi:hypothetical protein
MTVPVGRGEGRPALPRWAYATAGTAGVVVFGVGIYQPALAAVPAAEFVRIAVAVVGGIVAAWGWSRYAAARPGRPRPAAPSGVRDLPSFEIYSPDGKTEGTDGRGPRRLATLGGTFGHPPARRASRLAVLLTVVALLALPIPVTAALAAGATASPATPPAFPSALTIAHADHPTPVLSGKPPIPVCNAFFPPPYEPVGGLFMPLPNYNLQSPCKTPHDEVHLTFGSSVASSGDHYTVPVLLPGKDVFGPSGTYSDLEFGMVVTGNGASVGGQSYAELQFTPILAGGLFYWNVSVAVWSFVLNGPCAGLNVSYQNEYGCVQDEVGGGLGAHLATMVLGSTWANVTWVGDPTGGAGTLSVFFNDTTHPAHSASYAFTAANTGTFAFRPAFSAACPTACVLNWSTPFGTGLGLDLCEYTGCFSYNGTELAGVPPIEIGPPRYWTGLNYSGDYAYIGPASSTGACSGTALVSPCTLDAQLGDYPSFTFNGTTVDFGGAYTWTTESFGGPYAEFDAYGSLQQFAPFFVDELGNSSRADYLAPGAPLNVTVRVQDLGNLSNAFLSYTLPNGHSGNVSMTLVNGTRSFGYYNGSIPGTGPNGTITYRVWANNSAGLTISVPTFGLSPASVLRAAVPTVTVGVATVPAGCGGVSIGGLVPSGSGTNVSVLAGRYTLRATGCYPYRFSAWSASGGVSVFGSDADATILAHANGTVEAQFAYVRPFDSVALSYSPSTCGAIDLNGSAYAAGTSAPVRLLDAGTYALGATPCSGEAFSGWQVSNSANLSVLGTELTLHGNGTLTALFVAAATSDEVGFATTPAACGGVLLRGAGYTTGESVALAAGTYPVGPDPCAGYGFEGAGNVSTTGSVAAAQGTLTVQGSGTLTYGYYQLTLVRVLTLPTDCGGIDWDGVVATNGAVLNVTNHTQHAISAAPCPGSYFTGGYATTGNVSVIGSVAVVNGPGSIEIAYRVGKPVAVVGFATAPGTCGTIVFNGISYGNSQYVDVTPGTATTVTVLSCGGYGFVGWAESGGVAVGSNESAATSAFANASGSLTAIFHPLVTVDVFTSPAGCGRVDLDGQVFSDNTSIQLPVDHGYALSTTPCQYWALSGWTVSAGSTVASGVLELGGTATLTATFARAVYVIGVVVGPAACGEVTVNGVGYPNGSYLGLTAGAYTVAFDPCDGYELTSWTPSANLTVAGLANATLTVHANGTLVAVGEAVPPSLSLSVPGTAASGSAIVLGVSVAVPVPPFNYTFTWSFGDGTSSSIPDNQTSHLYQAPGRYTVEVTVVDPLGRTASAEANLTVVPAQGPLTFGLSATAIAVIAGAALVVVAGAVVAVVRARRAPAADSIDEGESGVPDGEVPVPENGADLEPPPAS